MANTASRLSANGSLTINGTFDEVVGGVTTRGLVAYLDANKVESYPGYGKTWIDLSGNKNDGAINGNVVFVANGTSSYFNWPTIQNDLNYVSGANSFNYQDFTIVFYPDPASTYSFSTLFSTAPASLQNDESLRAQSQGSGAQWYILNSGNGNDWSSNAVAANTVYYLNGSIAPPVNISSVYKGIYINAGTWNILGGSKSTNQFPSSWSYYLGSGGYPNRGWQGRIAAALFYDRPLSQSEQIKNYNYFAQRFGIAANTTPTVSQITANSTTNIIQYQSNNFDEVTYNPNNIGPTKNLFPNSQDFAQNYNWLGTSNITKNADVAPDGTRTANLYTGTGLYPRIQYWPLGSVSARGFGTPGKYYTQSLFVKYVNQQYCVFVTENWPSPYGGAVRFDLLNGTVGGTDGSITNATITPYPGGWYRITATWLIPSTKIYTDSTGDVFYWQVQWRLGNYDGTDYTGQKMLLWGYQLEEGNTATTYLATDFPKNLLLYSEDLANTNNWGRDNCTLSRNTTVDPNGNFTGQMLTSTITGGNNNSFVNQQLYFLPINTNYTFSVYVKQGTSPTTNINFYNASPFSETNAIVTWPTIPGNKPTVTYTTGSGGVLLASSFTESTNGWWRVSLSLYNGSSSSLMCRVYTTTNSTTNVNGYNVYVWGAQLEFGLVSTPYISNPNGGQFGNILPLANTNTLMKTTNTGNTFIKDTFDEYSKMSPITEGLIFNIDPGYNSSYTGSGSTMYDTTQSLYRIDLNNSPPYSSDFGGILKFTSTFGNNAWGNTSIPSGIITTTSNYTMSAWVKCNPTMRGLAETSFYDLATSAIVSPQANTGYSYGSTGSILGNNFYGGYGLYWATRLNNNGIKELTFGLQNRINSPSLQQSSPLQTVTLNNSAIYLNWTHIVGVYDSSNNFCGFYVNGVLVNNITTSQMSVGSFPFTTSTLRFCWDGITGGNPTGRNFDGDIGPVSIWNRALSATEVQQMYSSQRSRFGV